MENFINIKGFESLYMIDSKGNVKSLEKSHPSGFKGRGITVRKERILTPVKDKDGYLCINLSKNKKIYGKKIHRLVAEAFIPNPENKKTVNHKNGDKKDNCVSNLEWMTNLENIKHYWENGFKKNFNVNIEANRINGMKSAKEIFAYDFKTNEFLWHSPSISSASIKYGLDKRSMQRVLNGEKRFVKNIVLRFTKI